MPRRQLDVSRFASQAPSRAEISLPERPEPGGGGIPRLRIESASRLLEVEDVAEYLGMRTDWVYREVRAGRLPHIRLGRAVRFRRESIEAWIESRERGASTRRRP